MKKTFFILNTFLSVIFIHAQSEEHFLGKWDFENGKETLEISKTDQQLTVQYRSLSDGFEERFFENCQFINNQIEGSFWGNKNNVKIRLENHKLLLTIKPWHFASIINQEFVKKTATETMPYLLPNEKTLFSFHTTKNKILSLCVDTNKQYIVYRFGSEKEIELQFPSRLDSTSWDKFYYYNYHRGGGAQNSGIDEATISFTTNEFIYRINDSWAIDKNGEHESIGIEIDDLSTVNDRDYIINGIQQSKKGSLYGLRNTKENDLLNSYDKEEQKKIYSGWEPITKYALGDKTVNVYEKAALNAPILDELKNGHEVIIVSTPLGNPVKYYDVDQLNLWGKFIRVKYKKDPKNLEYNWGYMITPTLHNYKPMFMIDPSAYNQAERFLLKKIRKVANRDHHALVRTEHSSFSDFYNRKSLYGINEFLFFDLQLDNIVPYDSSSLQRIDPTGGDELRDADHYDLVYTLNGTMNLSPNYNSIIIGFDYYNDYVECLVNYTKEGELIDFITISEGDNVESFEYTTSSYTKNHILINRYRYSDSNLDGSYYVLINEKPVFITKTGLFEKK